MPEEQSELLNSWIITTEEGKLAPLKCGRILGELALTVAPELSARLPALLETLFVRIGEASINRLWLAVIASAYFDQYGELKRRPHVRLGSALLSLDTDKRFLPAYTTLKRLLKDAGAMMPYIPGSGRQRVHFAIDIAQGAEDAPRLIRDIQVGNQSALADPLSPNNPRRLTALLGLEHGVGCDGYQLRALIAQEYLVPLDCLGTDMDKKKVTWSPNAGLVNMDIESDGGLSALAEDES